MTSLKGWTAAACVAAWAGFVSLPAAAAEWELSAGPFTTASDVTAHNKMPLDIKEVNDALASGDWSSALVKFGFGGNFDKHSLARFTDDYNGRLGTHVATASKHFGTPSFQNHALLAALTGSGRFAKASPEARAAFVDAGLVAVVVNWSRYELGESARKAKAGEPNWSLQNGSPKNWNEIFAFYWGPEGKHSAFERVAQAGGTQVNERLLAALADGQKDLVAQKWAPEAAERVAGTLDQASIVLLSSALEKAAAADDKEREAARAAAAGYWLAAADALGDDAAVAATVTEALSGEPDRAKLKAASESVAPLL